jgi:ribosomal protein S20
MALVRLQEYLKELTALARGSLLMELERLEGCDDEIPRAAEILTTLRAEFRPDGAAPHRMSNPCRHFFAPLEPMLVDGAGDFSSSGRLLRGSLPPIWEWISRDLLPTMARDYVRDVDQAIGTDNKRKARQIAATFQTKVVKSLETTIGSADGAAQAKARLATYTASPAAFEDVQKMICVLRAREALSKFNEALPEKIKEFDDGKVAKVIALLEGFRKSHPEALPFALTLVANRLRTAWQLIRLATKMAPTKNAADVAVTPYALAVSMVLDRLQDWRWALRMALRKERVLVAKQLLTEIYDLEYALHVRIDGFDQSDWGKRLRELMNAISTLVEKEVKRFPDNVGHVLGSRNLRTHDSLSGRLTYLAWKGRDVVSGGAAFCKKLVGQG